MINTTDVKAIILNGTQWNALHVMYEMLTDLQEMYPEKTVNYLINPTTGEIVDVKEFGRMKAIIDFIANQPFQIELK